MAITVDYVNALTTKGIDSSGGVRDAVFKKHAYLDRLYKKKKPYSGSKLTIPFNFVDDTGSNGKFYVGAEALSLDMYDPYTELSFDLKEIEETLVITHRDIALNSGKSAILKLVTERLATMEMAMRQRIVKGLYSDGTAATGALSAAQFIGQLAFLKDSSVNYGGLTESDVATHIAYVEDNSGTSRALSTSLHQKTLGGASEGEEKPTLGIMRQATMNDFVELLKPHQRTTRDNNLDGLGHAKNTLVYSGVDHIVDNLSIANAITFLNEKHVNLYVHSDYDMKRIEKSDLETMDAVLHRLFLKGVYACGVLRYQGLLKDLTN